MSSTIQTKNKKRNNKNDNLHKAKNAKNDEFYTTRGTIEDELKWYKHHFKGKVVYCNCDDPYESEFFKYFMLQFKMLGLKKLIATCYKNSPVANKQFQFFNDEELLINCGNKAHKIEITSEDLEGENPSMENMRDILKRKKLVKNLPAKCDGSFDSKPCLKLLEEADIVVTNPPFSQFRQFVHILEKYNKKFIIWGNNNAITYKEIFPLIKENKMWLGYTANKTCVFKMPPTYEKWDEKLTAKYNDGFKYGKVPAISVFTNLDIPKRHHDLDMWKDYNAEDYPHYDNYDAINVDKVSEIPKDYCESWGLYSEEYKALDKTQWEEVRREQKDDTELIYVIPKEGAELRKLLHEHADGYKETIEKELANSIYCNGCMGVPITMLDKYNPKQLEIVKFRKGDDEKDLTYTEGVSPLEASKQASKQADYTVLQNHCQKDTVTESLECQLHSLTSIVQNSSLSSELPSPKAKDSVMDYGLKNQELHNQLLINNVDINDCLQERYCSGCVGVPITFMDKYNPKQFEIIGLGIANLGLECGVKPYKPHHKKYRKEVQHK